MLALEQWLFTNLKRWWRIQYHHFGYRVFCLKISFSWNFYNPIVMAKAKESGYFAWVWQSGLVPPNVPKKDKMPQMKNKKQAAALSAWEMLCVKAVGKGEGRAGESVPPVNFGQNRCKISFRVKIKLEDFFYEKVEKNSILWFSIPVTVVFMG